MIGCSGTGPGGMGTPIEKALLLSVPNLPPNLENLMSLGAYFICGDPSCIENGIPGFDYILFGKLLRDLEKTAFDEMI